MTPWHPSTSTLTRIRDRAATAALTYSLVGATRPPGRPEPGPGWHIVHERVPLGHGVATWQRARRALLNWQQFNTGWTTLFADPPTADTGVVVAARVAACWHCSCGRVIDVIDDDDRLAVIYGTTAGHPMRGEERFQVDIDADGVVMFDLASYSQPHAWWLPPVLPIMRACQRRFARDAAAAMQRAVEID